jgi:hypothetical protein
MEIIKIFSLLIFTSLAASYAWAMRGTKIGGEKGAMLPGAVLGLIFAWFSGYDLIRENFFVFSAVGALAMSYGGSQTYGETLSFVVSQKPPENYKKGIIALIVKGSLWFGIFGAYMGMAFNAACGQKYNRLDFIVLFAILVPLRGLGVYILNRPVKPRENIFPKIYFSKTRNESWGGLLFVLLALTALMAAKGDTYSLGFTLAGAVSGAVGWVIGINLFYLANHPLNNGKFFYGKLQEKGYVGGWKIMEFTLGAVGGLGTALYFFLNKQGFSKMTSNISGGKLFPGFKANALSFLPWIALFLIFLPASQHLLQSGQNSKIKSKSKADVLGEIMEWLEEPIYSVIILSFIMLGNLKTAKLVSFFLILWLAVEKDLFERFIKTKQKWLWSIVFWGSLTAALLGEIFLPNSYPALYTWILYIFVYEFFELIWIDYEARQAKENKGKSFFKRWRRTSEPTVHIYFFIQIVILLAVGILMFR